MDQGGGVLELHSQDLKMPHTMIMQDFGKGKYGFCVICKNQSINQTNKILCLFTCIAAIHPSICQQI